MKTFLAQSFYCAVLMMLLTAAALIISIVYRSRHRDLRIFTWYLALALMEDISTLFALPVTPELNFRVFLAIILTFGFLLLDFIVCNLFILRYIGSKLRRRIIRINGLLFFGVLTFEVTATRPKTSAFFFVTDCVFLVVPCLFYFYELFSKLNLRPLKDQPSFWVITGILFLHACDIPLFLTVPFLENYQGAAYTLNYILFSIFFVLLIRAYLCPPQNQENHSIIFVQNFPKPDR